VQSLGRALAERQRSDGGWATVVTQPHSVEETSTAAFAAAGFAQGVLLGVLDEDFSVSALAAWESVRRQVRGGILGDVSGAVWPSTVASHYEHVPRGYVAPWGQGPLLVAARNISRLTEAM
jgi:unsaturated rhamnogalacturonyl hydrolase